MCLMHVAYMLLRERWEFVDNSFDVSFHKIVDSESSCRLPTTVEESRRSVDARPSVRARNSSTVCGHSGHRRILFPFPRMLTEEYSELANRQNPDRRSAPGPLHRHGHRYCKGTAVERDPAFGCWESTDRKPGLR